MKDKFLILILLLTSVGSLTAQKKITLKEAVDYALENKADALKAALDIENADYLYSEARSTMLPQINAQAGVTYNPKLQQMALDFGGETSVIKMGTPWQSTPTIQLDQQLFNMSAFKGLKAAHSTKEFYLLNADLTEEEIIEKVANSYFEVFKTKSEMETLEQTIDNTIHVREVIANLEKYGLSKKIDLDRIDVNLNNLKSTKIQLENAVKAKKNALKFLIGMAISTPLALAENTFDVPQKIYDKESFDINNRTEVKILEKRGELLQVNKESIAASRYPSLSLSANYGYMTMGNGFPYFAGKNQGVNGSDFAAVSLNLNIPIFNGLAKRSKINQAQIEVAKNKADLEDTKLALNLALENAYTQINNAMLTLNSQASNQKLAQRVLKNVENNYKNGLASLTDLLDAENAYADAQNNHSKAVLDYKLAEVQLRKANGELKTYYSNTK